MRVYRGYTLIGCSEGTHSLGVQKVHTHWVYRKYTLIGCSEGTHSLGVQRLHTHWVFRGYTLIGSTKGTHSLGVQRYTLIGCTICTPNECTEGTHSLGVPFVHPMSVQRVHTHFTLITPSLRALSLQHCALLICNHCKH